MSASHYANTLSQQLFPASKEKLLICIVVSTSRHGSSSATAQAKNGVLKLLCVSQSLTKRPTVAITIVKKDQNVFRKKSSWQLQDLRAIDGCDAQSANSDQPNESSPDFELVFDRHFKFIAASVFEKNELLDGLIRLAYSSSNASAHKPEIRNYFSYEALEKLGKMVKRTTQVSNSASDTIPGSLQAQTGAVPISTRDASELEAFVRDASNSHELSEAFVDHLRESLRELEGANVHTIMTSEAQTTRLMVLIDAAIEESEAIADRLAEFERLFGDVHIVMDSVRNTDDLAQLETANAHALEEQLAKVCDALELDQRHAAALVRDDLSTPNAPGLSEAIAALERCCDAARNLPTELSRVRGVAEQRRLLDGTRTGFVRRVQTHFRATISRFFAELPPPRFADTVALDARPGSKSSDGMLFNIDADSHLQLRSSLKRYARLMHFLRRVALADCEVVRKEYVLSSARAYESEFAALFDRSRQVLAAYHERERAGSGGSSTLLGSVSQLEATRLGVTGSAANVRGSGRMSGTTTSRAPLVATEDGLDVTLARFDRHFAGLLRHFVPILDAERDCLVKVFACEPNEAVTHDCLATLFKSLQDEAARFVATCAQLDFFYAAIMLLRANDQLRTSSQSLTHSTSSASLKEQAASQSATQTQAAVQKDFIETLYSNVLLATKRAFDTAVQAQVSQINEFRLQKKATSASVPTSGGNTQLLPSSASVLTIVRHFEITVELGEQMFRNSSRKSDMERAYSKLLQAVLSRTQELAKQFRDSSKASLTGSPAQAFSAEIVLATNLHRLTGIIRKFKLSSLDADRKEIQSRYQEAVDQYVVNNLGRPLEKLNVFFDGLEAKLNKGVKDEEISFQFAFSRQEVVKVLGDCTEERIRKNLLAVARKMDRHFQPDEENLFVIVWRATQDEFMRQIAHIKTLIKRCYDNVEFPLADDAIARIFLEMSLVRNPTTQSGSTINV